MKYLITGGSGQLGFDIYRELIKRGVSRNDIWMPTHKDFDITDELGVLTSGIDFFPGVIFHCAAYTAVDKAETDRDKCRDVNVNGTQNIANLANVVKAKLIYPSTDYVFDGNKFAFNGRWYEPREYKVTDTPHPVNWYGFTKLKGEQIVKDVDKSFIFRISWVFGINGNNFIKTMLKLSRTNDFVKVVSDQVGSPTYTEDLAKLLVDASMTDKYGIYHATNEGFMSWADIAKKTFEVAGVSTEVIPIKSWEYPTVASRPVNSRLSKKSLDDVGFERLPDANDAIERYVKILTR